MALCGCARRRAIWGEREREREGIDFRPECAYKLTRWRRGALGGGSFPSFSGFWEIPDGTAEFGLRIISRQDLTGSRGGGFALSLRFLICLRQPSRRIIFAFSCYLRCLVCGAAELSYFHALIKYSLNFSQLSSRRGCWLSMLLETSELFFVSSM